MNAVVDLFPRWFATLTFARPEIRARTLHPRVQLNPCSPFLFV